METIKGYLRYEPDMKFTVNGTAITKFNLYDKSSYEGRYTTQMRVIAWEDLAEICARILQVDDFVYVKGYWKTRSWQTPEGETRTIEELTAKQVWVKDLASEKLNDITTIDNGG